MDEGKKKNPWEPQREQKLAPIHSQALLYRPTLGITRKTRGGGAGKLMRENQPGLRPGGKGMKPCWSLSAL